MVLVFIANPYLREMGRLLVPLLLKEEEGHKGGELVMYLKLWNVLAEIRTPRPLDSRCLVFRTILTTHLSLFRNNSFL